jgi:hypothetical protein
MLTGRGVSEHNECCGMGSILPAACASKAIETCFDYVSLVCCAIGLDFGIFDIEVMLSESGPVLIEANPRMMGGIMPLAFRIATGTSFEDAVLATYLSLPMSVDSWDAERFAVIRKIMPRQAGRLPSRLDFTNVVTTEGVAHFENYLLTPGREFGAGEVLARVITADSCLELAIRMGDFMIQKIELAAGVPLIRSVS